MAHAYGLCMLRFKRLSSNFFYAFVHKASVIGYHRIMANNSSVLRVIRYDRQNNIFTEEFYLFEHALRESTIEHISQLTGKNDYLDYIEESITFDEEDGVWDIYSIVRTSYLEPSDYIKRYIKTGNELNYSDDPKQNESLLIHQVGGNSPSTSGEVKKYIVRRLDKEVANLYFENFFAVEADSYTGAFDKILNNQTDNFTGYAEATSIEGQLNEGCLFYTIVRKIDLTPSRYIEDYVLKGAKDGVNRYGSLSELERGYFTPE